MTGYDRSPDYGGPPLGRWWWLGLVALIAVPILAVVLLQVL
jgi:hypothetical protein